VTLASQVEYKTLNKQIKFGEFDTDSQKFDYIFLNDVFEHVSNPLEVLKLLSKKLNQNGKIFIDTPRQFWLYPVLKLANQKLHKKLLRGTVSTSHLQIWSKASFDYVIKQSNLKIHKYDTASEHTMPADFYLKNMGITNPFVLFAGRIFYKSSRWLAANKILSVLEPET
jgi:2-polyprenyl-3-methyl-5-hydroxy-6-metoxy-1,4-benzoquinol methylase